MVGRNRCLSIGTRMGGRSTRLENSMGQLRRGWLLWFAQDFPADHQKMVRAAALCLLKIKNRLGVMTLKAIDKALLYSEGEVSLLSLMRTVKETACKPKEPNSSTYLHGLLIHQYLLVDKILGITGEREELLRIIKDELSEEIYKKIR